MNMINKKVIITIRNNRYFELWDLCVQKYERGDYYSYESPKDIFFDALRIENIPQSETIEEVCEMVYFDYDKFTCVLLHDNGTYTKHSLGEVRILKDE